MCGSPFRPDHSPMNDRGLHQIEDELSDGWLEDWPGSAWRRSRRTWPSTRHSWPTSRPTERSFRSVSRGLPRTARSNPGDGEAELPRRGLPGHPIHPPLTDATIGAYTFATVRLRERHRDRRGQRRARLVARARRRPDRRPLPTALTGLADWLTIEPGHGALVDRDVAPARCSPPPSSSCRGARRPRRLRGTATSSAGPFVLTLVGFALADARRLARRRDRLRARHARAQPHG